MEFHVACLCVIYVHSVVVLLEVGGETLRGALAGSEIGGRKKTKRSPHFFACSQIPSENVPQARRGHIWLQL